VWGRGGAVGKDEYRMGEWGRERGVGSVIRKAMGLYGGGGGWGEIVWR